jgi:hypothetical protein
VAARNDARPVTLRTDCEQQHSVQAGRSMSVIPKDFRRSGKEKFRKKAPRPSMTLEFGVSLIGLAAEAAGRNRIDPLFRDHGQSRAHHDAWVHPDATTARCVII